MEINAVLGHGCLNLLLCHTLLRRFRFRFRFHNSKEAVLNFAKYIAAHILEKFKYFMKQITFLNSPARKLELVCFVRVWFSSKFPKKGRMDPFLENRLQNRKIKIFLKNLI